MSFFVRSASLSRSPAKPLEVKLRDECALRIRYNVTRGDSAQKLLDAGKSASEDDDADDSDAGAAEAAGPPTADATAAVVAPAEASPGALSDSASPAPSPSKLTVGALFGLPP